MYVLLYMYDGEYDEETHLEFHGAFETKKTASNHVLEMMSDETTWAKASEFVAKIVSGIRSKQMIPKEIFQHKKVNGTFVLVKY